MSERIKNFLKLVSIPLVLLGIYLSMMLVWKLFDLPSDEELLIIVKDYFLIYGLWIVFVGALIEGFLLLGQYFPGGFIIFLGVITAGHDVPRVIEVVSVVSFAFFISYTLNYLVGKHGWYLLLVKFGLGESLEKAKVKLIEKGLSAIFLSYWEPNLASITATAAGVLKVPLAKFSFYSAIGLVFWNIFWGALVFSLGDAAMNIVGFKYVILIILIWIGVILVRKWLAGRLVR